MATAAAPTTPGTKRCPGFAGGNPPILPHQAQADLEHFNSNKGSKDGLSSRCRPCGNAYGKAWAAGKRAAAAASYDATVAPEAAPAAEPMPTRTYDVAEGGGLVPVRYHDELAERASNGEIEGYVAEVIDGITYALPYDGTATTPEGQAALEATNAAHAAARRKRDAERKRAERAAAKQAAASKA